MAADKRFMSPGLDQLSLNMVPRGVLSGTQERAGSRRSSDPAKIEQIHLGVYGETDSLEQALVAEEVLSEWPARAHENRRLDVEWLTFERFKEEGSPIQTSSKGAEPCAQ